MTRVGLLICILSMACSNSRDQKFEELTQNEAESSTIEIQKIPTEMEKLLFQSLELGNFKSIEKREQDLFGKFYDGRSEYYIIDDPYIYLGSSSVNQLTLYFVDEKLYKKKYAIQKDISSELIQRYGSFNFSAFRVDSTDNLEILHREKGVYSINPEYHRYRMMWLENGLLITYEVELDSISPKYVLHEELVDFRRQIARID